MFNTDKKIYISSAEQYFDKSVRKSFTSYVHQGWDNTDCDAILLYFLR